MLVDRLALRYEPLTQILLCEGYLGSRPCDEKHPIGFAPQTSVGFRKLASMAPLKHRRSSQADPDGERSPISTQNSFVKHIMPISL